MPVKEQLTAKENCNQAPFMGVGSTCNIFESPDLPTLTAKCVLPKCLPGKTVHQREIKTV